jgi:hypothetical protein
LREKETLERDEREIERERDDARERERQCEREATPDALPRVCLCVIARVQRERGRVEGEKTIRRERES